MLSDGQVKNSAAMGVQRSLSFKKIKMKGQKLNTPPDQ
jgi:hypothetical protein